MNGSAPEARPITPDEAEEYIQCDLGDGWSCVSTEFVEHRRWTVRYRRVIHFEGDDTYWSFTYDEPATEYQEASVKPTEMTRVYPIRVTKTEYSANQEEEEKAQ